MINVIMVNMKYKFSHEHNIEHSRSKMRALQHSIIGIKLNHNSFVPNYGNLVIKIIKFYMNCM